MPRPRDLTPEQAAAEGRRLRDRRREADRVASGLYARVYVLSNAPDADLEELPPDEASAVREWCAARARGDAND